MLESLLYVRAVHARREMNGQGLRAPVQSSRHKGLAHMGMGGGRNSGDSHATLHYITLHYQGAPYNKSQTNYQNVLTCYAETNCFNFSLTDSLLSLSLSRMCGPKPCEVSRGQPFSIPKLL